ncbi:phosphoribosylamine--glycine ligase [Ligilactobacillus ruminis]|uniref:Phosphoribosylamine--glycine ligase n=1 Tax=Ligilactobacillus ruminis TaxID=1623 RepID=A0A8B2YXY8_9LACO|nr:phosphoribosylamine--glycine ligase [Ligilactobacillus ruminis]RGK45807.1 phosphoribosylamine--glycine ligase [Ligilactobacillus ruminis]
MKDNLNLLVVGSGGREHAIAKKLLESSHVEHVYVAPGNIGMESEGISTVAIEETDFDALKGFAYDHGIEWTFVGPEDALCAGIVDSFRKDGLKIFGPDKEAARLEGSKDFALEFMEKHHVPTAKYSTFRSSEDAISGLEKFEEPVVIKADGLAGGKGVVIAKTKAEAEEEIKMMFRKGQEQIVLEEFLSGDEYSMFVVIGEEDYRILPMAQDHKRAYDRDEGPNTGGMGAYSPLPQLSESDYERMVEEVVEPTINGLRKAEFNYIGLIYIGMILTGQGPKVIEYNVRLGDPETQVVLPRIDSDFAELVDAAINGKPLPEVKQTENAVIGVVLAAEGYPKSPVKGHKLPELEESGDISIDYANVAGEFPNVTANGGRLLTAIATAETIEDAQQKIYRYLEEHKFDKCFYRKDIGYKATGKRF